jgi:hypothetical protein
MLYRVGDGVVVGSFCQNVRCAAFLVDIDDPARETA